MKISFPLLLLLLANILTQAQNKVDISSQTEVFYIGMETPVKIALNDKPLKPVDYSVQEDSLWPGRISYRKTDSCLWVKPLRRSPKKDLAIIDKNGKLLGRKAYFTVDIPDPIISLDAYKGGAIGRGLLCSSLGLFADYQNSSVQYPRHEISLYKVVITNGTETRSLICKGPLIPDTVRYYFQRLKFPYRVEFMDVTYDTDYHRPLYRPLVFESRDDGGYYISYSSEVGEFEDSLSKTLNLLPRDSNTYRPHNYPQIIETNCNSTNDTCSTYLYYLIDGRKCLALIYQFQSDRSERYKTFYHGVQLSDITFWNETNAVNDKLISVSVNYSNGQLMKEGNYYMAPDTSRSYCYRRDPVVYGKVDTLVSVFRQAVKSGPWKYYAKAKLIKTETYKNGALVGVKRD